MKTIPLTTHEFEHFKRLAWFWFDCKWLNGFVYVTADIDELDKLGF